MIELLALGALILAAGFGPDLLARVTAKRAAPLPSNDSVERDEAFSPIQEEYNTADEVDVTMLALKRAIGKRHFEEAKSLLDVVIRQKGPASE